MQLPDKKEVVDYYIVFTGSNLKHWVMKWLHPTIKHVYAIKLSQGGHYWQIINPLSSHTDIDLIPVDYYPNIRDYVGVDAVVLPVKSFIDKEVPRYAICVFNCVEVIKSLLGINEFSIFTPYQLYKYLTKHKKNRPF